MLLLSEIPFDSQLLHHFIFIECRFVSNSLNSPRTRFLVSLCLVQMHVTLSQSDLHVYVLFPPHFFLDSLLSSSNPCYSAPLLLIPPAFFPYLLYCFPLPLLYVTSRLSLTWSKYTVSECIENFSVLMSVSLHGVKDNKLLFVCLIAPHLPPPFDLHSIINIRELRE